MILRYSSDEVITCTDMCDAPKMAEGRADSKVLIAKHDSGGIIWSWFGYSRGPFTQFF